MAAPGTAASMVGEAVAVTISWTTSTRPPEVSTQSKIVSTARSSATRASPSARPSQSSSPLIPVLEASTTPEAPSFLSQGRTSSSPSLNPPKPTTSGKSTLRTEGPTASSPAFSPPPSAAASAASANSSTSPDPVVVFSIVLMVLGLVAICTAGVITVYWRKRKRGQTLPSTFITYMRSHRRQSDISVTSSWYGGDTWSMQEGGGVRGLWGDSLPADKWAPQSHHSQSQAPDQGQHNPQEQDQQQHGMVSSQAYPVPYPAPAFEAKFNNGTLWRPFPEPLQPRVLSPPFDPPPEYIPYRGPIEPPALPYPCIENWRNRPLPPLPGQHPAAVGAPAASAEAVHPLWFGDMPDGPNSLGLVFWNAGTRLSTCPEEMHAPSVFSHNGNSSNSHATATATATATVTGFDTPRIASSAASSGSPARSSSRFSFHPSPPLPQMPLPLPLRSVDSDPSVRLRTPTASVLVGDRMERPSPQLNLQDSRAVSIVSSVSYPEYVSRFSSTSRVSNTSRASNLSHHLSGFSYHSRFSNFSHPSQRNSATSAVDARLPARAPVMGFAFNGHRSPATYYPADAVPDHRLLRANSNSSSNDSSPELARSTSYRVLVQRSKSTRERAEAKRSECRGESGGGGGTLPSALAPALPLRRSSTTKTVATSKPFPEVSDPAPPYAYAYPFEGFGSGRAPQARAISPSSPFPFQQLEGAERSPEH